MKGYEIFLKKYVTPNVYKRTLDSVFGEEWRNKEDAWEPETIRQEIERIWAIEPLDEVFEKIMALQTYLTTDLFWDDLIAFENIVLAFNDRHVDPDMIQSCTPEELAYGVEVASRVRPERNWIIDIIEYTKNTRSKNMQSMSGTISMRPRLAGILSLRSIVGLAFFMHDLETGAVGLYLVRRILYFRVEIVEKSQ